MKKFLEIGLEDQWMFSIPDDIYSRIMMAWQGVRIWNRRYYSFYKFWQQLPEDVKSLIKVKKTKQGSYRGARMEIVTIDEVIKRS